MNNRIRILLMTFKTPRIVWLQFVLAGVAAFAFQQSIEFGEEAYSKEGTYTKLIDGEYTEVGTDVAVTAGYNGGAISMGLVCCVCIFLVIWIEVHKSKRV